MSEVNSTIIYKDIPGFPGYRISSDGFIFSCRTNRGKRGKGNGRGSAGTIGDIWKKVKTYTMPNGYVDVQIQSNGKGIHRLVHRLVLECFVGPCPDGMECCHNDGNRSNNAIENLRWDTRKANTDDRNKHGRTARGEKHGMTSLTEELVIQMRNEYAAGGITRKQIAKKYGVGKSTANRVILRQVWKHI